MKKIIKDIFLYSSFHAVYVSSIYLYYRNNILFYGKVVLKTFINLFHLVNYGHVDVLVDYHLIHQTSRP